MESPIILVETQIVIVMAIASLVAILTRRIRIPYTVALVLAGLALAFQEELRIELTPDLVLALFVPPLLFEAALHVEMRKLRSDIIPILTMAVPGVMLSSLIVAAVLTWAGVLPFPLALLFGALISATDPVAVVATFRSVGAPKRLTTLVEGESLFNDGTAVVFFNLVLAFVLTGEFHPTEGVIEFVREVVGGLTIGIAMGYLVAQIIARIDDYLIEITLTTLLAYSSYLLADNFHFSGVLAVVAAGLVNGNLGPRGMSPTTRIVLFNFWEYLAFLSNSFIFVLIGMNVDGPDLQRFVGPALLGVVAVLVARAINVYGLGALVRLFMPNLPPRYLHVMFWGGLRGAISLAMALSIPRSLGDERTELLQMTFAVVLFTLLIQATTIPTLLRRLKLTATSQTPLEYERIQGKLLATRAARRHLDRLYNEGAMAPQAWVQVKDELDASEKELYKASEAMLAEHPNIQQQIVRLARLETLRAQRAALSDLAQEGLLSNETLALLEAEVDEAIESPNAGLLALNHNDVDHMPDIDLDDLHAKGATKEEA